MEEQIVQFIRGLLEFNVQLSYIVFFISSFLQVTFPPYPGDSVTVLAGYATAISNSFGIVSIIITSVCGTILGSYVVHAVGFRKGESVLNYKWVRKFLPERKERKAKLLFKKYGAGAVFISKFVPGINTIIILFAGIFKMKKHIVYLSFVSAAIIHNTILTLLGRFLGYNMEYIESLIKTYNIIVLAAAGAAAIGIYIYFRFFRKRRKRMK